MSGDFKTFLIKDRLEIDVYFNKNNKSNISASNFGVLYCSTSNN